MTMEQLGNVLLESIEVHRDNCWISETTIRFEVWRARQLVYCVLSKSYVAQIRYSVRFELVQSGTKKRAISDAL